MGRRHKLRVHSDDSSTYVEESFEVMFVESMGGDFFLRGGGGLALILSLCEGGLKLILA